MVWKLVRPQKDPLKCSYLDAFRQLKKANFKFPTLKEIDEYFLAPDVSDSDLKVAARTLLVCPNERTPFKRGVDISGSDDLVLPYSNLAQFSLPPDVFVKNEVYLLVTPLDVRTEGFVRKKHIIYPETVEVLDYSSYLNVQFNRLFGLEGRLDDETGLPSKQFENVQRIPFAKRRKISFTGNSRLDIFCLVKHLRSVPDLFSIFTYPLSSDYPNSFVDVATLVSDLKPPYRS
ncbi:hypothetical protein HY990_06605 [Candidatus Micrarchaeota archaeon]|nr:hypothetical protein [Candidatus Micrarchaeota archaeon]